MAVFVLISPSVVMRKSRFIERSLAGALSFLREALSTEEYARRNGFLQARDPRLKLLSIGVLLCAVLWSRHILFLSSLYFLCLLLAVASSISLGFFLKRTWFFIPLFALLIGLPAVFSFFSPGERLMSLRFFGLSFVITRQGFAGASIFFMRVLTSVSLTILLVLTTSHSVLLKALRITLIPQVFVMTLEMCYRYVYLFIGIISDTYFAIKSRVGYVSSSRRGQRIVAWNIASLWHRSYQLQVQVYEAMLSRGYTGEPKVLERFHCGYLDWCVTAGAFGIFFLSVWINHFLN
jgi:cobalt/nickel transport system permease protein